MRVVSLLAATATFFAPAPGQAGDDPFAGLEPMADEQLDEKRGGFVVAGYDIEVGLLVETHQGIVAALVTDPTALRDALESAGEDPSLYPWDDSVFSDGLVTVIENDLDNQVLSQTIRIDAVIVNEIPDIRTSYDFSSFEAALPRPGLFSSF